MTTERQIPRQPCQDRWWWGRWGGRGGGNREEGVRNEKDRRDGGVGRERRGGMVNDEDGAGLV